MILSQRQKFLANSALQRPPTRKQRAGPLLERQGVFSRERTGFTVPGDKKGRGGSPSNLAIPAGRKDRAHNFPDVLGLAASPLLPSLGVAGTPARNCVPPSGLLTSGGLPVPKASL